MKRISIFAVLSTAAALAACSSTSTPADGGGTLADGGANPAPPSLSTQIIDRMGRAGVNTAVTDPFDLVTGKTVNAAKDEYNSAADPSTWVASFAPQIAKSLAVLDSLDTSSSANG